MKVILTILNKDEVIIKTQYPWEFLQERQWDKEVVSVRRLHEAMDYLDLDYPYWFIDLDGEVRGILVESVK